MKCNENDIDSPYIYGRENCKEKTVVGMFIYDYPVYDLDVLWRCNLHIHTAFSRCAKPEMTVVNILRTAYEAGLSTIALTDHFNYADYPAISNISVLREQVRHHNPGIRVLYGAELSACGQGVFLDSLDVNRALDYRLYSCNHYHLDFWEHPALRTPRGYALHALNVLDALIDSGRADCIAHPFIGRFVRCFEDRTLVTQAITDAELGDILSYGTSHGVAWEVNLGAMLADPAFARRYWNLGRETGAFFHFGSDAHRLCEIAPMDGIEKLKRLLA